MQLTKHFSLDELTWSQDAARHGIDNEPPAHILPNLRRLAAVLEQIRTLVGAPVFVTSGYRCEQLNLMVGGARNSAHLIGCAADIRSPGLSARELANRIVSSGIIVALDQCIDEFGRWVHVSVPAPLMKPRAEVLTATRISGKVVYSRGLS